jgi:signal transduction histidine kinase
LALLAAGGGGAFLTLRMLQPVRHITRTAETIGAKDLSQRLPVQGSDEFAELCQTFNAMLERLDVAFQRMEAVLEQQRRFTADASHELKTPLTIIKANASLMLKGERTADAYRRAIATIDASADSMTKLVQDLRSLPCCALIRR